MLMLVFFCLHIKLVWGLLHCLSHCRQHSFCVFGFVQPNSWDSFTILLIASGLSDCVCFCQNLSRVILTEPFFKKPFLITVIRADPAGTTKEEEWLKWTILIILNYFHEVFESPGLPLKIRKTLWLKFDCKTGTCDKHSNNYSGVLAKPSNIFHG